VNDPQGWGLPAINTNRILIPTQGHCFFLGVGRTKVHKPDTSDHASALSIQGIAQLSDFSKRATCSLARSYVERDAIFKLRYRSYLRAGLISQNSFGRYIEPADHAADTYLIGLYVDHRLVSSLRRFLSRPLLVIVGV
jgi:hypothetical protein